jgi:hypothetical protein
MQKLAIWANRCGKFTPKVAAMDSGGSLTTVAARRNRFIMIPTHAKVPRAWCPVPSRERPLLFFLTSEALKLCGSDL